MSTCFCTWGPNDKRCCINRSEPLPYPVKGPIKKMIEPAVVIHPGVKVVIKDDLPSGTIYVMSAALIADSIEQIA